MSCITYVCLSLLGLYMSYRLGKSWPKMTRIICSGNGESFRVSLMSVIHVAYWGHELQAWRNQGPS